MRAGDHRTPSWCGAAAIAVVAVLGPVGAGCAATSAETLANRRDFASLRGVLAARQRAGDLSNAAAASIARSVVAEEIRTSSPADAVATVRDIWACAKEVDSALAARMRVHDEAGAQAALARLDAHSLEPSDVRKLIADADSGWRAVGARSLVRVEDRDARLRDLVDPSPLVRRQAARAAHDAADVRDMGALAEAARLDPEPIVRTEAVRALGALPAQRSVPEADVATALRDVWTSGVAGDDALREDIAIAWASPSVWSAGGRDALRVVVASGRGPGVIEGAAAVLRRREADVEVRGIALGVLSRAISDGSRAERLQALAEVPLDPAVAPAARPAVEQAAEDDDLEVRVSALSRLVVERVDGALQKLEALAQPGSPVAARARFALAVAGDRRIQGWLEQDLAAEGEASRLLAANALAALGVASRAAPLLADSDAPVRVRAACTIVAGARFRR